MSKKIMLFDVDGTITEPMVTINDKIVKFIKNISEQPNLDIAIVGGSDFAKQSYQLGECINLFKYVFSENGLAVREKIDGNLVLTKQTSIIDEIGDDSLQKVINYLLSYMSTLILPAKRGNFIELRTGMLNISPIGRSCTQEERNDFIKFDNENNIREKMKTNLLLFFKNENIPLTASIGGQISIDVYPIGWDKTYCLKYIENTYKEIHFFGDKVFPGGNDYEIYNDERVIGHHVNNPTDTINQVKKLLNSNNLC